MINGEGPLALLATNPAAWATHALLYTLAVAGVYLALRPWTCSARGVSAILGILWLRVTLNFWLAVTSPALWPAYVFAAVFLVQSILMFVYAVRPGWQAATAGSRHACLGLAIIAYALIGYPLAGVLAGHPLRWSAFGLTPSPLVTFTLGALLLTVQRPPGALWIAPLLYSLTGFVWVASGSWEDIGLILSAVAAGWSLARQAGSRGGHDDKAACAPATAVWSLDIPDLGAPRDAP